MNRPRPLQRLIGLETEYAIRFDADDPSAPRPADYEIFQSLCRALRQQTLLVPASEVKEGVFLGTAGAIWFERVRFSGGHGLVEGSTPECRGPFDAVTWQRAQDELLEDACRDVDLPGQLALIKNDRDSHGNIYGAQENYEIEFAPGWRRPFWKCSLVLLLPLLLFGWLGHLLILVATVMWMIAAGLAYLLLQFLIPSSWRRPILRFLMGDEFAGVVTYSSPMPGWLEAAALFVLRLLILPLGLMLYAAVRWFGLSHLYGRFMPFLVTRAVLGGAGTLDKHGRFKLSDKADAINCGLGYNGLIGDRPVFSIGHFFKVLMFRVWAAPREFFRLMEPRQRLQVCLGDSNMCEVAELLRVGSTALVLDALEAGYLEDRPRVRWPIGTLHRVNADTTFQRTYRVGGNRRWTGLEIQQYYCNACARYLRDQSDDNAQARQVLELWQRVLSEVGSEPQALVGQLDWVTKQMLIEETGHDQSIAAAKKLEIRYHELSPDGYFRQLESAGVHQQIIAAADRDRARRLPPANTRASTRGRYIREFAEAEQPFAVSWSTVTLGRGLKAKVIELQDSSSISSTSSD